MESEEARGPGLPRGGETSGRQGEENSGTQIEVRVGGQKTTKMQIQPPHSCVVRHPRLAAVGKTGQRTGRRALGDGKGIKT